MAAETEPYGQPTLLEKIGFIPLILKAFCVALFTLVISPFTDNYGTNGKAKLFMITIVRDYMVACNVRMLQWISAPTEKVYQNLMKKKNVAPQTNELPDGAKAHWIGNKGAKNVLLFLHGGGYCLGMTDPHKEWLWDMSETMTKKNKNFAIVALQYTVAPQAQYPTQLRQAVTILRWLVEDQKKDPANILLCGDSAGGHLLLSLLSHLLHPHPSGIPPLKLAAPLKGAILISPLTTLVASADSWRRNRYSDYCHPDAHNRFVYAFVGKAPRDNYLMPLDAPSEWWNGLDGVVKSIFIWSGGKELLADPIKECAEMLKKVHADTTLVTESRSCHEEIIMDSALRYPRPPGQLALDSWLLERL